MNIEIKNLDELIGSRKVSVAGYTIDLNELPIKITLEVMALAKNIEGVNEEVILENVVVPSIKHFYPDNSQDEIKESLSYRQVIILWQEIINSLYGSSEAEESQVKKK